jgi:hypothetical protein
MKRLVRILRDGRQATLGRSHSYIAWVPLNAALSSTTRQKRPGVGLEE